MDTVFTYNYKKIDDFQGFRLSLSDNSRWICCLFKESLGKNGEKITLIDNFCETYTLIIDLKGLITVDKGSVDTYNKCIMLAVNKQFLYKLPDIAIDVLQTTSLPVGFEVLSRIAEAVHRKLQISK
jgi:hypothetical protein